jgi:hypothetical protein
MNARIASIAALGACAVADLAAAPLLLGSDDVHIASAVTIALSIVAIALVRRMGWQEGVA